jgi:hypothetical protein
MQGSVWRTAAERLMKKSNEKRKTENKTNKTNLVKNTFPKRQVQSQG